MDRAALLRSIPAFAGLNDQQSRMLAARLELCQFARRATIFSQGSPGDALYIILHGQVRIFRSGEGGRELLVAIYRDGEFFGELALLDGKPRSASATTMRPTTLLALQRADFLETLCACPSVAIAVLEALASRLRRSTVAADELANASAAQRVTRWLVELAARHGQADGERVRIALRLTQDDLAGLAGTTRETANRVLGRLQDQRLIRIERAGITVMNLRALADLADEGEHDD
jgi:CRP-like cAMP-binding protein